MRKAAEPLERRKRTRSDSYQLLPALRELYSRLPETYLLEPWELAHVLFSLGYVEDLVDEAQIAAAAEVARGDYLQWRPAA